VVFPDKPGIEHYVHIVKENAGLLRSAIRLMDNMAARCDERRDPLGTR
jgi:hypothetical protein